MLKTNFTVGEGWQNMEININLCYNTEEEITSCILFTMGEILEVHQFLWMQFVRQLNFNQIR